MNGKCGCRTLRWSQLTSRQEDKSTVAKREKNVGSSWDLQWPAMIGGHTEQGMSYVSIGAGAYYAGTARPCNSADTCIPWPTAPSAAKDEILRFIVLGLCDSILCKRGTFFLGFPAAGEHKAPAGHHTALGKFTCPAFNCRLCCVSTMESCLQSSFGDSLLF